jgi:hypothetical protein
MFRRVWPDRILPECAGGHTMSTLVFLFVEFLMLLALCFWINVVAHDIKCNLERAKEELKFCIDHGFKQIKFDREWNDSLKDKA